MFFQARTDVVFPILGLSQLFDEVLDGLGRRSHKAKAAKMAHLLPLWVVEAAANVLVVDCTMDREGAVLSKVDFMVEEGGLRRRGRYYRNLGSVSNEYAATWESRQTHSLVVEEEDLHLGRGGACRSAVPDRHHFGDVAGDGLYDIHSRGGISRNLLWAYGSELEESSSCLLFMSTRLFVGQGKLGTWLKRATSGT